MCIFDSVCKNDKYSTKIKKNVETMAGFFDVEIKTCTCCGAKSSKFLIPEPKVKKEKIRGSRE